MGNVIGGIVIVAAVKLLVVAAALKLATVAASNN